MRKSHSVRIKTEKRPEKKKETRQLPETKQKSLQTIKTVTYLDKVLSKLNIVEEDVEDIIEEEAKDIEDTVTNEESEEDDLTEDYEETEDDYIEYDEPGRDDLFDVESRDTRQKAVYIVEISVNDNDPSVKFLHLPQFDTDDTLIRNTLLNRYKLFNEMACFIAEKQKGYFSTLNEKNLTNLNQEDLVKYMENKKYKLSKEHVSRLLDALFFQIKGLGDIPSKYFFRRYGHKTGLSKEEELALATEFLAVCDEKLTRLEKAKRFRRFIKDKTRYEIPLSKSNDENNQYRNLKNIIKRAEDVLKDEKN